MNLVVDQVRELEHVDVANSDLLRELVAGHAVVETDLAALGKFGEFEQVANVRFTRAVEHRRGKRNTFAEAVAKIDDSVVIELRNRLPDRRGAERVLEPFADCVGTGAGVFNYLRHTFAEFFGSPAEVRFENLSDVHTRRNAQRV